MKITKTNNSGFTIVELLIVIVVIGILAAITIVAFNGIQDRAHNTAVESDLAAAAKKLEIYRATFGEGQYPVTNSSTVMNNLGLTASKSSYDTTSPGRSGNFYYCPNPTYDAYAMGAVSKSGQNYFLHNGKIEKASNVWGSTTCAKAGWTTTSYGLAGWGETSGWQLWIK